MIAEPVAGLKYSVVIRRDRQFLDGREVPVIVDEASREIRISGSLSKSERAKAMGEAMAEIFARAMNLPRPLW
jgi:hypothetical protein